MRRASVVLGFGLSLAVASVLEAGGPRPPAPSPSPGGLEPRLAASYSRLPLRFERNDGQVDARVKFLARGPGHSLFVTPAEMVLSLRKGDGQRRKPGPLPGEVGRAATGASVLRVRLLGARRDAEAEGLEELPGRTNYFKGNDPRRWRTDIPGYARVRSRGVYPGIDVVYYVNQKQVEYDFVVAPGADPRRIRLGFEGARDLRLDAEGNLVVALDGGEVVHHRPRVHQEVASARRAVEGRFVLRGRKEAGFALGPYDTRQAVVIDPVLSYSTYLGGSEDDSGVGIAVDGQGSAYVGGITLSADFPTQDPLQTAPGSYDVFVAKLSPSGDGLVYSTYLGGSSSDFGGNIAVDGQGSAYVVGETFSTDFPTQNPYQEDQPNQDVFVTKLSPSGSSLVYSTYLGGGGDDYSSDVAVDGTGSAHVVGYTLSTDFPTLSAYQTDQASYDVIVTKLAPSGSSLVYSTYLGGDGADYGDGIAVDGPGSAYVTGTTLSTDFPTLNPLQPDQPSSDAFVTKLSPSGDSLVYSTYLGGDGSDDGRSLAVDGQGSAYVIGDTQSTDFPTQSPYQADQPGRDAFVTKLSPSGDSLVYSTYLGGNAVDNGIGIAVDGSGSVHATGRTFSTDFPTRDPYQTDQPLSDAFVTKLAPSGSTLSYSSYLGGAGDDIAAAIAVDSVGSAHVVGTTGSADFPTQGPFQADQPLEDAFVAKLGLPSTSFFTLSPCRPIDTRNLAGPRGGPALAAGADRTFALVGQCSMPPTVRAVAVNVTVTAPTTGGHLRLYPAGTALPNVSTINYSAGQTRANNAILSLNTSGEFTVRCAQPSGTTHFILDVTGYFE
jgi:hypothetical protein